MRVLLQRVREAWVEFDGAETPKAGAGLVALVGFGAEDESRVLAPMASKIAGLRVFEDEAGHMNRSLLDCGGGLVLVSQFTLYADCRKGRRPSFSKALEPARAEDFFNQFAQICVEHLPGVILGKFAASMRVHLVNDGPVTILLDSEEIFPALAQGR